MLTPTRRVVLRTVADLIRMGYSPTVREIGSTCGRTAPTIHTHLRRLEADGYLVHVPASPRTLRLTDHGREALAGEELR